MVDNISVRMALVTGGGQGIGKGLCCDRKTTPSIRRVGWELPKMSPHWLPI